jgi:hypothetical protein
MKDTASAALVELERLLDRQVDAIRQGDADALPALAEQLRQRLGQLAAGRTLAPGCRPALASLMQRAGASQAMLARRQRDVERSLKALTAGMPGLQDMQALRVYGASGLLAATPWRSRGFERA